MFQIYQVRVTGIAKQAGINPKIVPTPEEEFRSFIDEANEAYLEGTLDIKRFTADSKVRPKLLGMIGDGGKYCCHKCTIKGTLCDRTVYYPYEPEARRRTTQGFRETAELVKNNIDLPRSDAKGIREYSPFHDLISISLPHDILADSLHVLHEGVAKFILTNTFSKSESLLANFPVQQTRVQEIIDEFDSVINSIKYPKEISRRIRSLSLFRQFKGLQYRFVASVFAFYMCMEANLSPLFRHDGIRSMHLLLLYLTRAYYLPQNIYEEIAEDLNLQYFNEEFCTLIHEQLGIRGCRFLVHQFSHFQDMRNISDIAETSTVLAESSYGSIKSVVNPNCRNIVKQCLKATFVQPISIYDRHVHNNCWPRLKISPKKLKRGDDALVFTNLRDCFKVMKAETSNGPFTCQKIKVHEDVKVNLSDGNILNFTETGILEMKMEENGEIQLEPEECVLNLSQIIGKGIVIHNIIYLLTNSFLLER